MAADIGSPGSVGEVAGGTAASASRGKSRQSQPAAPLQQDTGNPPATSAAAAAGKASGEMVPSDGPPAFMPQHELQPRVVVTAKATPVPGVPATA